MVDKAVPTRQGSVWYQLHSEREDISETLVKTSASDLEKRWHEWHGDLLQRRLQKIDGAMDRLMSGSFGDCSKCGRRVDESKLALDPAIEFCVDCWEKIQTQDAIDRTSALGQFDESATDTFIQIVDESDPAGIAVQTLAPLDTICVSTRNSDYRIFLLEPETGRALVQGGKHFVEPVEALIYGSVLNGKTFKLGWVGIGMRLEFISNYSVARTSPVQSFHIETHTRLN
jgi:RNA polymerase-binding transcription factor DksA